MAIIMISSVSLEIRQELAESLSAKLGWPCVTREELWEQARDLGINIGRLETSMVRSRGREEKLAREKDNYLACITTALCQRAADGNLVYSGQSGHLLLPGVSHRIRVGLCVPRRVRLEHAMLDLSVSRDKTLKYLEQLDSDLENWVRYVHQVDPSVPDNYDFFINTENVSIPNVSAALCVMADLPDFRPTPASMKLMADLDLAARARMRLALDSRTANADIGIVAEDSVLTVTYMPRQKEVGQFLPEVLGDLEGCRELDCTMADTNIVLIQERFGPEHQSLQQVMELAPRWGAAVELIRWTPRARDAGPVTEPPTPQAAPKAPTRSLRETGGVEDDDPVGAAEDDGGLAQALEQLVAVGRSGGGHSIHGSPDQVLEALQQETGHSLVIVGDVFLGSGPSARTRETRGMAQMLQERLQTPVVTTGELQSRYRFGVMDAVKLLVFSVIVGVIYTLVFLYQEPILEVLGGELHSRYKVVTAVGVGLFVPLVAYAYSRVTGALLKLVGID